MDNPGALQRLNPPFASELVSGPTNGLAVGSETRLRIAAPGGAGLLADTAAVVVAAVHFDLMTAVIVGLVAGLGQALGKLALDTLIQDYLAEAVRTSAFARSETVLQLAWVLGGIFACIIPTDATIGMYAAAVVLLTWTALVVAWNAGRGPRLTSWGRGPRT